MNKNERPNRYQEQRDFESYQKANPKKPWNFPFREAFKKLGLIK